MGANSKAISTYLAVCAFLPLLPDLARIVSRAFLARVDFSHRMGLNQRYFSPKATLFKYKQGRRKKSRTKARCDIGKKLCRPTDYFRVVF